MHFKESSGLTGWRAHEGRSAPDGNAEDVKTSCMLHINHSLGPSDRCWGLGAGIAVTTLLNHVAACTIVFLR